MAKKLLGSSANKSGSLVEGLAFLDQGSCGSTPNLSCTTIEIKLGGESNASYIRILQTPFSVPVSFVFSRGCASFGQCFNQTCRSQILECRAPDASAVVIFCPEPPTLVHPPSTTPSISSITSPLSAAHTSPPLPEPTAPPPLRFLHRRENQTSKLLGAELGGTIGGAFFLLLLVIGFIYLRRRRERLVEALEARMPQRQETFVVNPTWVLGSPTTPEGAAQSHLSLPDRARPRTIVPFTHQMSLPNLSGTQQYRPRVLRPRASTVGSVSVVARTEDSREHSQTDVVALGAPTPSETGVWRPRIDILAARQQRAEVSGPAPPEIPMQSFWAE